MKELKAIKEARANLFKYFGLKPTYGDINDETEIKHWQYRERNKEVHWGDDYDPEWDEFTYSGEITDGPHVGEEYTMIEIRDDCGGSPYYMIFTNSNQVEFVDD